MEEITWINLPLPADFSRKIDRLLIDLKDKAVIKTKVELTIELLQEGYKERIK